MKGRNHSESGPAITLIDSNRPIVNEFYESGETVSAASLAEVKTPIQ